MHTFSAGGAPIGERLADIDSETGPEGEGFLGAGPEGRPWCCLRLGAPPPQVAAKSYFSSVPDTKQVHIEFLVHVSYSQRTPYASN